MKTEFQRFVEKIKPPIDPVRDCWEWIGCKNGYGYGAFRAGGKQMPAHRYSFDISHLGPLTPGRQIDHLCRNRSCVNPSHMEQVSSRDNISRGLRGSMRPGKSSRFVGVCWNKRRRKWLAQARSNGKLTYIGLFAIEEDAARAYRDFIKGIDAKEGR